VATGQAAATVPASRAYAEYGPDVSRVEAPLDGIHTTIGR